MSRLFFVRPFTSPYTSRYAASPDRIEPLDTIVGTPGNDTLTGTVGNDDIDGGAGADTMIGGAGSDRYRVDNRGDVITEGERQGLNDAVYASISYRLTDNVEHLTLIGSAALNGAGNTLANRLTGNAAANVLDGDDGGDTLIGNAGDDTLQGGLWYDSLLGGDGRDELHGNNDGDVLNGGAGEDRVYGDAGFDFVYDDSSLDADTLDGGSESDTLIANWSDLGGDIAWVGNGAGLLVIRGHEISGFERFDLTFGAGNDLYDGSAGISRDDTVVAAAGSDTLTGGNGGNHLYGDDGNDTLTDGDDLDFLYGGAGDDLLISTNDLATEYLFDDLQGGDGNDTLIGGFGPEHFTDGRGNDWISGGAGDDWIELSLQPTEADTVDGGEGVDDRFDADWRALTTDTVWVNTPGEQHAINGVLISNVEELFLRLGSGNDTVINNLVDSRYDYSSINGGAGDDHLVGDGLLYGGTGNDTLGAGPNGTSAFGEEGDDSIVGGRNDDTLNGHDGNDTLSGGKGADRLDEISGTNQLTGGSGADIFIARAAADWAPLTNIVLDFEHGVDTISFDQRRAGSENHRLDTGKIAGPGGFSTVVELVIVQTDIAGALTASAAAAAIGSATGAYAVGTARLFVVDNGADSAVFQFRSADADAAVEADELSLVVSLIGVHKTTVDDYMLS